MKKLFFMLLLVAPNVEAKRVCLDIPDEEIAIVETYVPDAEEWIRNAWAGKVNNRREALIKEQVQFSLENQLAIPADQDEILKEGMKRMKSRKKRDKEEEKNRE